MLIRNAKDSAGKAIEVWLRDGKIAAVGLGLLVPEGEEVLDAKGRTVLPAFIDTHCHWRTPGFEYKEDISTGSAAAAAGGYTFVNLMPNTKPVCSSAEIAHAVEAEAARVGLCDANQTVSITKDFDGKTLDHLLTLPEDIKFQLIEPLRTLFKDEVRAIGTELGLPDEIVWRQPFPGPGLGIRIIGEITKERLDLLREADAIAREELSKAGLDRDIWQCPVVLLADVHSVGVQGDERTYGSPIVLRPVSSEDAMTADWSRVPYDVLATISTRITNECRQINRVVLDCTSKPPATIEWE